LAGRDVVEGAKVVVLDDVAECADAHDAAPITTPNRTAARPTQRDTERGVEHRAAE
jgi:hypothetical protein